VAVVGAVTAAIVGRYINLDRSEARRAVVEAQIERFDLKDRYTRFAAIDGASRPPAGGLKPGEVGCFLSHYEVLREHAGDGRHVHVLEDDVVFGPQTATIIDMVADQTLGEVDILYTDVSPNFNQVLFLSMVEHLRGTGMTDPVQRTVFNGRPFPLNIAFLTLGGQAFTGANAYIVGHRSIERLVAAMAAEIARGPTMPVDVFYAELFSSGAFSARCTVPFLTSIAPPHTAPSTIGDPPKTMDLVCYLMRSHFFIDRDIEAISALTASLTQGLATPDYAEPMVELMRFLFSDRFALAR
jgi:GR25 family glycosyltransferase involved in LPS biosynthesis